MKRSRRFKAASKNVIPAKAGIQKLLTSPDSRLRGSNKLKIIRGPLKYCHLKSWMKATIPKINLELEMLPVGQPLQDHLFQGPIVLPFTKQPIHHAK